MAETPRRAAILTPFFVDRDAVCNDVYHSARVLRAAGWDARVFAVSGESAREEAHPLAQLGPFLRDPADLAYFHFSTGRRDMVEALAALRCRKILKFHNITPPELFSTWSDEIAEANRIGRHEMPAIAKLPWEAAWGDSAFNLAEIAPSLAPGTPTAVLPPFHETDALIAHRGNASPSTDPPHLLTVGRIAQSKGHAFLLRVMRYLVHDLRTPAILDIVGKPDSRLLAYLRMLELMVAEFALEPWVRFHGEVATEALAARYGEASAFLCASEHEGFCVPLVEAMAFGVPVVALATTAVPETVGEAGLVWEERDPRRFALSIQRLLREPGERRWLGEMGRARFEGHFANGILEARLRAAVAGRK
jgi:glycosyltransferase involved in cell wall biosynthesis